MQNQYLYCNKVIVYRTSHNITKGYLTLIRNIWNLTFHFGFDPINILSDIGIDSRQTLQSTTISWSKTSGANYHSSIISGAFWNNQWSTRVSATSGFSTVCVSSTNHVSSNLLHTPFKWSLNTLVIGNLH